MSRYVAPELAALWLADVVLAFTVAHLLTASPAAREVLGASWQALDARLINHAALLASMLGTTAIAIGLYRPDICLEPRRVALNAAVVALIAFPVALAVGGAFSPELIGAYAAQLGGILAVWVASVLLVRWALRSTVSPALLVRRVLLVGAGESSSRLVAALRTRRAAMFEVAGAVEAAGTPPSLEALRRSRVWALVATGGCDPDASAWMLDYKLRGIEVFDELAFCERHLGRISLERLSVAWLLGAEGFGSERLGRAVKRATDIVVSLAILVLTMPLMALTALAVRLDSPGPALYRQERAGLHGQSITLLKFRSMRVDAEAGGTPRWAARADSRVTRVGAFIRSTRIDELPQLLNVLRGDMSLVGPRPERPHFVEQLAELIPFYTQRSYVKPGLTGWAQVNYPYGASVEDAREKLAYDLYYVKNQGFFLDMLVLLATVRVILFREGAR